MKPTHRLALTIAAGLLLATNSYGSTAINGPYTPDLNTLHLWHMDSAVPVVDAAATGGANLVNLLYGAALGTPSYTGFGTALNTIDGGQDTTAANGKDAVLTASSATPPGNITTTIADPFTGAFTFEAIVWIGFDPDKTLAGTGTRNAAMQILSGESTSNGNRIFQWRIAPKGFTLVTGIVASQPTLTFENVRAVSGNQASIYAPIPITGDDAIVSNAWYHVAVTYNGVPSTAGNLKFYWTKLDPSRGQATEIPITSTVNFLTGLNPLATVTTPLCVGNLARNITTAGANFVGLIDEVRISKVARAADRMMFGPLEPTITSQPVNETVAPGQPASFSVANVGAPPFTYQWRRDDINIPDATNSTYNVPADQTMNVGTFKYDVVIRHEAVSTTSDPAYLTVRTPLNLVWAGSTDWTNGMVNWDSNGDSSADVAYSEGDNVIFNGLGNTLVFLEQRVHPSAITFDSSLEYTISTDNGGGFERNAGILKKGTGRAILETINNITGPLVIQEGTLQFGSDVQAGSTTGGGTVTNNGNLVFYRGTGNVLSNLVGTGSLEVGQGAAATIGGTNTLSGPLVMNGGSLSLNGAASKGNFSSITMNANTNPGPQLVLNGVSIGAETPMSLLGTSASPDKRCTITAGSGTNEITATMTLTGDGAVQIVASALGQFSFGGVNAPTFMGKLLLRGGGTNYVNGPLKLGLQFSTVDGCTWVLNSTDIAVPYAEAANGSTMRLMQNDTLPPGIAFNIFGATLDLAGHTQQIAYLVSTNTGVGPTNNYGGIVGSSSQSADSMLIVNSSRGDNVLSARIFDAVNGGTRKTGLQVKGGGTLTLLNATNTYTGDTLITSGTLALSNAAAINNSANIILSPGATLSALGRTNGSLTITAAQTLKGDGAFNVLGNLLNQGTIELKVTKTGGTLAGDKLQGITTLTYGGTLKVDLSGDALAGGNSIKLFDATSYSGAFASIVPSGPGFGLTWDTTQLTTSGTLSVKALPTTPTQIIYSTPSPGVLQLEWPANYTGWILQAQTNGLNAGLSNNWVNVPASTGTNRILINRDTAPGTAFYRLILP